MAFPETRLTLIGRLAAGGSEEDWRCFLNDYWGPVCRFALRFGARSLDNAEDVASETFAVLWEHRLLVRWMAQPSAKLRTLLCGVVRNLLANRGRLQAVRDRFGRQLAEQLEGLNQAGEEQADAFYAAWAEDLVEQAVDALAAEYYCQNKGDYVRVLYGRLCEQLPVAEVAEALELKRTDVVNYFRHARQRLAEKLEERVRRQVSRYVADDEVESQFALEWQQLCGHLADTGGLEAAVRRAYALLNPVQAKQSRSSGLTRALTRLGPVQK